MRWPSFDIVNRETGEVRPYSLTSMIVDHFLLAPVIFLLAIRKITAPKGSWFKQMRLRDLTVSIKKEFYLWSILLWVSILNGILFIIGLISGEI